MTGHAGSGDTGRGDEDERPLITLDFDGVIASPFFGRNLGIHRGFLDPAAAPRPARVWPRWLNEPLDRLRYEPRRPLPEALDALRRLASLRRLVVLTGRRSHPGRWMRRYGLEPYFESVVVNDGAQRSPHYKLAAVQRLGAREHVEDDPRTAQLLAEHGIHVYLRDWPRNRDLAYHAGVERIADLDELAQRLSRPRAPEGEGAREQ
ncbi:MAG: hypothetical protein GEU80_02160 [Dehalococcoidia bacterium]|nr:hypothetical protein [Dehalococcoidia bacterium]